MNPLLLLALTSGLGGLGGMMFPDRGNKNLLDLLQGYANPTQLTNEAMQIYSKMVQSPAFSAGQADVAAGANAAASTAAGALADRGLNTSGIGTIINSIGNSTAGFKMGDLRSQLLMKAFEQAMQLADMRLGAAGRMQPSRNVGADIYGAGLNALGTMYAAPKTPTIKPAMATGALGPGISQFQKPTIPMVPRAGYPTGNRRLQMDFPTLWGLQGGGSPFTRMNSGFTIG